MPNRGDPSVAAPRVRVVVDVRESALLAELQGLNRVPALFAGEEAAPPAKAAAAPTPQQPWFVVSRALPLGDVAFELLPAAAGAHAAAPSPAGDGSVVSEGTSASGTTSPATSDSSDASTDSASGASGAGAEAPPPPDDAALAPDGARTLLVLERKDAADLAASLADGRYREQRARLQALKARGVGAGYVVELPPWTAALTRTWGRGRAALTEVAMQRLLARLQLRHGFAVLQSASVAGTAVWVRRLADMAVADPYAFSAPAVAGAAATAAAAGAGAAAAAAAAYTEVTVRKAGNRTTERTALSMLVAVPGVGLKAARAVLAAGGGSVAGVAALTEAAIAAAAMESGRRVGAAVAKAVFAALHDDAA
jgi:ERCC4-type nuclease